MCVRMTETRHSKEIVTLQTQEGPSELIPQSASLDPVNQTMCKEGVWTFTSEVECHRLRGAITPERGGVESKTDHVRCCTCLNNAHFVDIDAWTEADPRNTCFHRQWHCWDASEAATAYCCARSTHFEALHTDESNDQKQSYNYLGLVPTI